MLAILRDPSVRARTRMCARAAAWAATLATVAAGAGLPSCGRMPSADCSERALCPEPVDSSIAEPTDASRDATAPDTAADVHPGLDAEAGDAPTGEGSRVDDAGGDSTASDASADAGDAGGASGWDGGDARLAADGGADASSLPDASDASYASDASDGSSVAVGLVAFYRFDETTGTSAQDSSGNGNTATLVGGASFTAGLMNNAATLNGNNEYVQLPTDIVTGLTAFSISTWVKLGAVPQWARVFDFGTGTTRYMFFAANVGGSVSRFAITTAGNGMEQQTDGPVLVTARWQHIVITLQAATSTLFVDSVQVGQNTNATLTPSSLAAGSRSWLGRSQFGVDPYLNGQIDNFRIYNRALGPSEVQELFQLHE